ncbi:MAG: Type 1 glutamine amidotransferase-like domain-containing protein [Actinomycetota bacterium]
MAVFVLMGSGEFMPWAREVDTWAAERATASSERALILPTAAAPEGDDMFNHWAAMGAEHFTAIGLQPHVLPLKTRDDASRSELVDQVADARYIFFSGGNPGYLAKTLIDTPFWEAARDAMAHGTAFGGCSAGASAVGSGAPDVTSATVGMDDLAFVPGLPLFTEAVIAAHFDMLESFMPGLRDFIVGLRPEGQVLFGIDEDTAACGDGETWDVKGKGKLTIIDRDSSESEHASGSTVTCSLGLALGTRF